MMVRSAGGWLVVLLACLASDLLQTTTVRVSAQEIAIAVIVEEEQTDVPATVAAVLRRVEQSERTGVRFREHFVHVNREEESSAHGVICQLLSTAGLHAVLDLTWSPLAAATRRTLAAASIAHFRLDITGRPPVAAAVRWLHARDASDAIVVFAGERALTEGLYELMQDSLIRCIAYAGLSAQTAQRMQRLRPVPAYTMLVAGAQAAADMLDVAQRHELLRRPDTWNVLLLDDFDDEAGAALRRQYAGVSVLVPEASMCCRMLGAAGGTGGGEETERCACAGGGSADSMTVPMDATVLGGFVRILLDCVRSADGGDAADAPVPYECPADAGDVVLSDNMSDYEDVDVGTAAVPLFASVMTAIRSQEAGLLRAPPVDDGSADISYHVKYVAWSATNGSVQPMAVAHVDADNVTALMMRQAVGDDVEASNDAQQLVAMAIPRSRRFYRVGITEAVPWTYAERDPRTGEKLLDPHTGQPLWAGYCIDMIARIADILDFDYELVPARRGSFGERRADGIWDGLVGDLITGETDIAVGALKMTAEREEVIDFIPPYFEQTGILIVIRNPVRQTSLFKFMTVLRLEVWLSIVAALFATAIMIWLLDKYSPYSARNNPTAYPYPCRRFTLKESFWFALTSFTPQGGGEAPKSLSGRTMVSAYWLFVVLMLATFTANLAAFLTVERMQTPVQSLEQLARQSRINYTVVADSDTHQYFRNMKFAEDTLYRVWKEITLNSTHDQARYRVWEYPIREQYGQILMAIETAQPVRTAAEGFEQVNNHENADYAFIHDSAEIKYEISRNCNLTEVGEVFAEQPYAIGIQQGSNLQDDLTRTVLRLQRERFFDDLTAKFWNQSAKGQCPNSDDSEGITLESLGGVFIATLFGLALSMVTLVGEVLYYRRRRDRSTDVVRMVQPIAGDEGAPSVSATASTKELLGTAEMGDGGGRSGDCVTIGSEFVTAAERRRNLAYISIFPRRSLHGDGPQDPMRVD